VGKLLLFDGVGKDTALEAESRISDADVAQEAADLLRSNILQSAATSLLAQAASAPEIAIRLLSE